MNNFKKLGAAALALGFTAAHAAVDVTAANTEIGESKTAVLAIGLAVFGVSVAIKLYKWLTRAL